MSALLDELIKMRKEETTGIRKISSRKSIAASRKVMKPETASEYPASLNTNAKRALYDNLGNNEALANELDGKIMKTKKDGWRDNIQKTKAVKYAIEETLTRHRIEHPAPEYVLNIVRKQQDY